MEAVIELTKEQRHEIYKVAKDLLINELSVSGLCEAISRSTAKVLNRPCDDMGYLLDEDELDPYANDGKNMGVFFPEVYKHKPAIPGTYWFQKFDKNPRIKILEQCIEETKPI